MKQFNPQEIQDRFEKLPPEMQDAMMSVEINEKVEAIGKKNNLMIDQIGEMADEVALVMLGFVSSEDFVGRLISRCSIDRETARKIATDINTEVFDAIRSYMRQTKDENTDETIKEAREPEIPAEPEQKIFPETNKYNQISALEHAGDMDIVEEGEEDEQSLIENTIPEKKTENISGKTPPIGPKMTVDSKHTDIIADHLLNNPIGVKHEKIMRKSTSEDETKEGNVPENLPTGESEKSYPLPNIVKAKSGGYDRDPYREAI